MLLDIDGLDKNWEEGIPSDWEVINKNCKKRKIFNMETPFAITKLNRKFESIAYSSEVDKNKNIYPDDFEIYSKDGYRVVSDMPLDLFQNRLIEHFDIRFKDNDIVWPKRTKKPRIHF